MTITISGTTGIAGVDGSAATPSVQGADTNTGIFFPAADTVGISTGGVEQVRIDSAGIVTGAAGNLMLIAKTSVTLTNQTSVSFTSIPSWARRITVMFKSVSGSGTSNFLVQVGTTTATTSGYFSVVTGSGTTSSSTAGFLATGLVTAATAQSGTVTLSHVGSNNWVATTLLAWSNASSSNYGGGNISHPTVVDMVRVTTVNGTDTFDAGSINIMYE